MLDNDITFDVLISYLGQPERKIGNEYVWQCPYCLDTHRDNLKYNDNKRLIKCFANDEHATDILREIRRNLNSNKYDYLIKPLPIMPHPKKEETIIETKLSEEDVNNNLLYMLECMDNLQKQEFAQEQLLSKRGIRKDIANHLGIGIDTNKQCFVFPIFSYSTDIDSAIIGFEYRPILLPNAIKEKRTTEEIEAKKKISRKKGSLSGLAMINHKTNINNNLAIVEGFLDGYALFQYLTEIGQIGNYHIITPSNGIGVLKKQIKMIDFNNYIDVYLYADNDEKSMPIVNQILEEYPQVNHIALNCCKDFNEHYLKCIKKRLFKENGHV